MREIKYKDLLSKYLNEKSNLIIILKTKEKLWGKIRDFNSTFLILQNDKDSSLTYTIPLTEICYIVNQSTPDEPEETKWLDGYSPEDLK